ncbi:DNA-packaging protein [Pararhodobacter zhoushanensis]|uniref:DNA-packaging protein n=1 Tax=Pararhodobacter zhoushanensis TaxID=2479545 RepID=UPI003CCC6C63
MQAPRCDAEWLACAPRSLREAFLAGLSDSALTALPWLFDFWALPHQRAPEGAWRTWVCMGGRGAGKTRAGAEWVRAQVEGAGPRDPGVARRVALVGETLDQVREVMIFGESGIMACSPPDRRPKWEATRKRLVWPNGAVAQSVSAHAPESLRGPQFDAAWADELGKWKKSEEVWDQLQFALRLGDDPRCVVTTTPRAQGVLKEVLGLPSTTVTRAPTTANRAFLAASFLTEVEARYGGSHLGRQELEGQLLEDAEGTLFPVSLLAGCRAERLPAFSRVVVAVDPAVSAGPRSDLCGIVVVGAMTKGPVKDWRAVVLEDASIRATSPTQWAEAAIAAMDRHGADRLVAEVNQGGNLVESVLRSVDPLVPVTQVHATANKKARAEPVAALYEQGRVRHVAGLAKLEEQMALMTTKGFQGKGSPDRLDALVWALHALMLEPASRARRVPSVRSV